MTIFLLSAIIIRPFTGKILDLVGKRKMLWISLLFYLICTMLYYFTSSFILLLILRFVQGIWFSIATTASVTLAADNIPNTRRGAGLGYFMMSTNLAVVIGPFIGLFIIQSFSFDLLFILLSVLMLAGALLSLTIPADHHLKIFCLGGNCPSVILLKRRHLPDLTSFKPCWLFLCECTVLLIDLCTAKRSFIVGKYILSRFRGGDGSHPPNYWENF